MKILILGANGYLGLPTCIYEEMINKIHEEIKNKDKFLL